MKRFISALSSLCLAATAVFSAFPATAAAANTVSAKTSASVDAAEGTVVYRFVPDGQSNYSESVKVEPGQSVKLNLTVENDPGTAGAQLYLKFSDELTLGRSAKGTAYTGNFQWSASERGLVWTCTDGHEQQAADGATIYSFTVTVPSTENATYSVDLDKNHPKGNSVRPQGSVTEAEDIPFEFHGVKLVVGNGGSSTSSSTTTPAGTVVYNFVPNGKSYSAGNPNTCDVKAGDSVKVDLTVKNDPGTAGGELYLDFGSLSVGRTAKGSAYSGSFQYSANTNALVWTCTDGHNQKAADGSIIYSFTVTVPSTASKGDTFQIGLNPSRKSDNSIRPQGGVTEASDIPFELNALKLTVSDGGSSVDPSDAIIYNFVPDGDAYASGSTNSYNVKAGQQVKVNLTVKNDAGTAGAEMYFKFDENLTLGRTTKGTAYTGNFQWSAADGALVWTCTDGHNQTAADGAIIYSFTVTVPATAAKNDSFLIDVNPNRKGDISIRPQGSITEAPDHKYVIHGLKLVVSDDPNVSTESSNTSDPTDAIIYNFVPDGDAFASGDPNSYNVKAGQQVKVNLTVKNDAGTAGAEMYFKFDENLTLGRTTKGTAYTGNFQWSAADGALVWTCTDGHNQTASDNAIIYSFTVTVPATAAKGDSFLIDVNPNRKGDISIRPQGSITEAPDHKYVIHGLKLVVSDDPNVSTESSNTPDPTDAIIYNFVPDGDSYAAGNPNSYNVKAGQQVKVNLTVKNDAGTAGAEMYFKFDENLTLGRTTKGTAYTGNFQWSAADGALVWTCTDGHNQTASDNAVIYSFTVTVPATAAKGDSFLIDVNPNRKGDISIRPQGSITEAPDHKYVIHGLKLVVSDDPNVSTESSSTPDPTDAIIYNFVPDGAKFTAGNPNSYNVQPGQQVKVNLTVKNDAGTAGAEMYFKFDDKLTLGRTTKGTAYTGNFQWSAADGALVWTCTDGHNQTAADDAVIYSFNVTIPATAEKGDSFLIDVNPDRKGDISIRPQGSITEAPDHKYVIHGLKLVVADETTESTTTTSQGNPAGKVTWSIDKVTVKGGTPNVEVPVYVEGDEGTAGFVVKFDINKNLKLKAINWANGYSGQPTLNTDKSVVVWAEANGANTKAGSGAKTKVMSLVFEQAPNAKGTYDVKFDGKVDAVNTEGKNLTVTQIDGAVIVEETSNAGKVTWSIDKVEVAAGTPDVEVPVYVEGDEGTAGFVVKYDIDSNLKLKDIVWADGYSGEPTLNTGKSVAVWAEANGSNKKAGNGAKTKVMTLVFEKAPADKGEYPVNFDSIEVVNTLGDNLTVTTENGVVIVTDTPVGKVTWTIDKVTVAAGTPDVEVPVYVEGDEGTSGFVVKYDIDANLKLKDIVWADGYTGEPTLNTGKNVAVWAEANGANVTAGNGAKTKVMTLVFEQAPETAGEYPVKFDGKIEVVNTDGKNLTVTQIDGAVIVEGTTEPTTSTDTEPTTQSTTTLPEGTVGWYIARETAAAGATVKVPVTVKQDTGTAGFVVSFKHDSALQFTGFEWGEAYAGEATINKDKLVVVWAEDTGANKAAADNAVVMYLIFTAPDAAGEYPVEFAAEVEAVDTNGTALTIFQKNGAVIVEETTTTKETTTSEEGSSTTPTSEDSTVTTPTTEDTTSTTPTTEDTTVTTPTTEDTTSTTPTTDDTTVTTPTTEDTTSTTPTTDDTTVTTPTTEDTTSTTPTSEPGTGSTEPGTGSTEPGTGSTEPGTGTQTVTEPGTGTTEPGTGTTEPGTGTTEPGTGSTEPGTGTTEPGTGTTEPGTGSTEPGTGTQTVTEPGTGTTEPGTGSTEPGTGSTEPGTGSTEPGTGSTEPGTGSTEPGTGSTEPSTGSTEPGTGTTEPGTGSTEPGTGSTEPGTGSTEPGTGSTEPGTGSTEPGTGSTEPGTGSTEPGTGSSEPGTGSTEPGTGSSEPGTGSTEPGTGSSEPGTGSTEPGTGSSEPGTGSTEPGTGSTEPGTGSSEPGTGSTEPGTGSTEPGTGSTEPGTGSTEPGTGSTEPGTGSSEPGTGSTEPGTGSTEPTTGSTTTVTLPDAGTVAFVVGSETFKQGEQKDVPISILTLDGVSKISLQIVVPEGFKLDNFKLSDTMMQSGMLTLDTLSNTVIWQSRGGDYTPAPGEVLGYATLTCLEDTAEGTYPLTLAEVHPTNAAGQELKNTVMNGKLTVLPALTIVTSYKVDWVEPGRICYWSHDTRSFKDAHGLDEMQTILTVYKYYVNASNQFVDVNGRVLTYSLYDPNAATLPVTPDMAFEAKTMDVTEFTHTDDAEQSAANVWNNEVIAQFGSYTTENDENTTHANKYDLKFYLNFSEITDPDFQVAEGKLEVGSHTIYIGVKGDTDLDNHVTAYDASLALMYSNMRYNAGFDDLVWADVSPDFGSEFDELRFFVTDVCCADDDIGTDGNTWISPLDATKILQYFNTKYNAGFEDTTWADEDIVGYDFPDNVHHGFKNLA